MTGQVYNGTMVYRGQVYDGAFYEYECCLPPTNYTDLMGIVRTAGTNYTDLVGVACGSFIPPVALSPDDPMHRTTSGLDLVGGASMGLFYIISGFVLMLGYGSAPTRPPPARPPARRLDLQSRQPRRRRALTHNLHLPQVPDARCREAPNARTAAATAPRPTRAAASRASARRARW